MTDLRAGEALLIARRRWGWSQPELAERAMVGTSTIKRLENGDAWARHETLESLDRALDGELFKLLGIAREAER